ncbi:hypothetical protein K437DRAFT_259372 [Tilletiaria anomala UBC 951]|uniref:Uncharacterized protein n=1 Tax=Tilletiaria anomala (strain ATCC 24038 / CBS 436.72 / UBC 951) TaxID=1037660 RepID=A0A066VIF5_TILAU|nr:uncharacterized protein K437DRAFT_259372 [Tilletiaria anomala UBC 951]KDN38509.1 hypothetical protein K437DRAFT_259372 [Tilletiaria anomala UBC 951]
MPLPDESPQTKVSALIQRWQQHADQNDDAAAPAPSLTATTTGSVSKLLLHRSSSLRSTANGSLSTDKTAHPNWPANDDVFGKDPNPDLEAATPSAESNHQSDPNQSGARSACTSPENKVRGEDYVHLAYPVMRDRTKRDASLNGDGDAIESRGAGKETIPVQAQAQAQSSSSISVSSRAKSYPSKQQPAAASAGKKSSTTLTASCARAHSVGSNSARLRKTAPAVAAKEDAATIGRSCSGGNMRPAASTSTPPKAQAQPGISTSTTKSRSCSINSIHSSSSSSSVHASTAASRQRAKETMMAMQQIRSNTSSLQLGSAASVAGERVPSKRINSHSSHSNAAHTKSTSCTKPSAPKAPGRASSGVKSAATGKKALRSNSGSSSTSSSHSPQTTKIIPMHSHSATSDASANSKGPTTTGAGAAASASEPSNDVAAATSAHPELNRATVPALVVKGSQPLKSAEVKLGIDPTKADTQGCEETAVNAESAKSTT